MCAAFLDLTQSAPNVVVELIGSTCPSTYPACCVNVQYCSLTKEYPWVEHLTSLPKRGVGTVSSVSAFNHSMTAHVVCLQQLNLLEAEQTIMHIQVPAIKVKS